MYLTFYVFGVPNIVGLMAVRALRYIIVKLWILFQPHNVMHISCKQ